MPNSVNVYFTQACKKYFRLIYVAYFKKIVILDAVEFSCGEALDNRICGRSLIKITSRQIFTINNVRKLAKTTKLFKPYSQIGKCFNDMPYFYSYKEGFSDRA